MRPPPRPRPPRPDAERHAGQDRRPPVLGQRGGHVGVDEPGRYHVDGDGPAAQLAGQPGRYDLVVDPSNLWLTIHESIGHATELDRALGYEAAYAGTSFATPDKLGRLQYGSALMYVTGDRTGEHGLATIGYDDEGVAAQSWDLITGGC
jgi:hypothetical protein